MQVRVCEEPKPRKGMCKAIHKWEMSVSWEPARAKSKQKKQGPRVVSCMLVGDAASCSTEVLGQVKSRPCPPPQEVRGTLHALLLLCCSSTCVPFHVLSFRQTVTVAPRPTSRVTSEAKRKSRSRVASWQIPPCPCF